MADEYITRGPLTQSKVTLAYDLKLCRSSEVPLRVNFGIPAIPSLAYITKAGVYIMVAIDGKPL